jgi:hypothetical protein
MVYIFSDHHLINVVNQLFFEMIFKNIDKNIHRRHKNCVEDTSNYLIDDYFCLTKTSSTYF